MKTLVVTLVALFGLNQAIANEEHGKKAPAPTNSGVTTEEAGKTAEAPAPAEGEKVAKKAKKKAGHGHDEHKN